jgi:hypothetical protein
MVPTAVPSNTARGNRIRDLSPGCLVRVEFDFHLDRSYHLYFSLYRSQSHHERRNAALGRRLWCSPWRPAAWSCTFPDALSDAVQRSRHQRDVLHVFCRPGSGSRCCCTAAAAAAARRSTKGLHFSRTSRRATPHDAPRSDAGKCS